MPFSARPVRFDIGSATFGFLEESFVQSRREIACAGRFDRDHFSRRVQDAQIDPMRAPDYRRLQSAFEGGSVVQVCGRIRGYCSEWLVLSVKPAIEDYSDQL